MNDYRLFGPRDIRPTTPSLPALQVQRVPDERRVRDSETSNQSMVRALYMVSGIFHRLTTFKYDKNESLL